MQGEFMFNETIEISKYQYWLWKMCGGFKTKFNQWRHPSWLLLCNGEYMFKKNCVYVIPPQQAHTDPDHTASPLVMVAF